LSSNLRFKVPRNEDPAPNGFDTSCRVMLIGFIDQENLGLGYLASTLRVHGHSVEIFDFGREREEILAAAKALDPILIGFSLIFQFYIDRFGGLIRFLRDNGCDCHFTMGGHFPSLSHEHTLELVPELDSVVRFEGELTLLELVDVLGREEDWRQVEGIAFQLDGEVVTTAMRPLIKDLDELPYPERGPHRQTVLGRIATPILASRGCARTCSFCSIHMFYRTAPGKVVRTRRPEEVVREMRLLHEGRGVSLFQFQDDDFPLFGKVWRRWAAEFVAELHRNELPGRVIWKINSRADAVEPELMASMRDAGLYLVYMGLESGSEQGLKMLHKQCSVEQNIRAVEILKEVGIRFEFGFMLFDPSTTFESIRENVSFLRTIVGDGSSAAGFCRMIPYDGTPIKDDLARTGRLQGNVCHPDYNFLDPRVESL
jgi:anaerobic magnesium-protoporphyrin IX monomethyl ester cyclase